MKNIFVSLLLVNVVYFAYKTFSTTGSAPVVIARSSVATVESIYLLSENANSEVRDRELKLIVSNPVQSVESSESIDLSCLAVGPFHDIFVSQSAADRLLALGFSVEVKAMDVVTELNDYRVMIPPAQSLQSAFRKLRELKSQGIDSYVITQGAGVLSISLGVFSTEQAALNLQSE
ncbi:MAG: SPOR domain-containing protein, partial [Pseudomonadales bacterium]|nr:SPOR domain-containing protein [Pseudomonadales bacterium]